MALGIYKPGQGYWVRVLTAVGAGALVLASAAWAFGQAVNIQLPARAYTFELDSSPAGWEGGSAVSLMSIDPNNGDQTLVGTGVIETISSTGAGSLVTVADVSLTGDIPAADTEALNAGGPGARVLRYGEVPVVEPLYVQGGLVAVVLLLGMIVVFMMVGLKKRPVEFLIATDGEMRKVNWSSRREVMGSTWVVIAAAFLISAALFSVDWVFAQFFKMIHVLQ